MPSLPALADLLPPAWRAVSGDGAGDRAGDRAGIAPQPPHADSRDLAVLDDPVEQRRFTRYRVDAGGRAEADSSLRISGMHCAACAGVIEQALGRVPGVLAASVSAAGERALVR